MTAPPSPLESLAAFAIAFAFSKGGSPTRHMSMDMQEEEYE